MSFWMAWKMILGNKERTFFPFMGIVLGLAAMVAIFSLGAGGEESVKNDLSAIASNRIVIGGNIELRDLEMIENLPIVEYGFLPGASIDAFEINLQGYSKKAMATTGYTSISGREILISKKEWPSKNIGDRIDVTIGNRKEVFIVKGYYESNYSLGSTISGRRGIISLATIDTFFKRSKYDRVVVTFPEDIQSGEGAQIVLSNLRRRNNNYNIMEASDRYKRVAKIKKTINLFLGAMCVVALVMGGLGISNLMAAMVRERTGHIGILRAFGMNKDNVMEIFIYEAMVISGLGGILGSIFGVALSKVVGTLINVPPVFMGTQFVMIICMSLLMGLIFGLLPAKKAAEMEPIDALRTD